MKRYIKSSIEYDYPIDVDSTYEIDEADLDAKIRDILKPAAEFVSHVDVHLGSLSINDIRVFSNLGVKQLRVTYPTKSVDVTISGLLKKLEGSLPLFISNNQTKQASNQRGAKTVSAMTMVANLIRGKFGYRPTWTYSNEGKLEYSLTDLPFVDPDNMFRLTNDIDRGADEMDEYLNEIKSEYDLDMHWSLPTGGSWIRASWKIYVPTSNGYFIFDKDTKEYRRV